MAAKFIVNGKEKDLRYNVNGTDISDDFIGNTFHGMAIDEEGRYIASPEDFNWWETTIVANENMDAVIAAYKEKFDADEVDRVVQDWVSNDLDTAPTQVIMGLRQVFGAI